MYMIYIYIYAHMHDICIYIYTHMYTHDFRFFCDSRLHLAYSDDEFSSGHVSLGYIYKILYGLQSSHVLSTCKFMLVHHEKNVFMLTQHEEKVQCSCAHSGTHAPKDICRLFICALIGSQTTARLHWFVANMIPSIPSGYDCHSLRT